MAIEFISYCVTWQFLPVVFLFCLLLGKTVILSKAQKSLIIKSPQLIHFGCSHILPLKRKTKKMVKISICFSGETKKHT